MPLLDSDVAILGTGLAPLVAANHLLNQGKSVLLLNPDLDFFLEDSELPLDPLLKQKLTPKRLANSLPDQALSILRPEFPGAIEFWSRNSDITGYHDPHAPHVRQRGRLWISSTDSKQLWDWEELEDLYVEASDADLNPQILDGLAAARRFPGFASHFDNFRGLYIPKLCDVDIVRYRNGLLEYIRERLGPERLLCAVNSVERMPEAVRFHSRGTLNTARLKEGMLVFWTPRLSSWILNQSKKAEIHPKLPKGVRVWEEWFLNSREVLDPNTVGMFGDMAVWAAFEGTPASQKTLAVLRAGPLVTLDEVQLPQGGLSWASTDSFGALSSLCHGFLKWDRFSIRSMKARAVFEWEKQKPWLLSDSDPLIWVIPECDGPLIDVVQTARSACDQLTKSLSTVEGH
jgi:hypothetical protein